MQPSDNLSFAVSKISEACFSPHVLRKKVRPLPLRRPRSHRFPCQTESFSAKFPNGTGGRGGRFFSATGDLPPNPRECTRLPKMRSNRDRETAVPSWESGRTFDTFLDNCRGLQRSNRDFPSLA